MKEFLQNLAKTSKIFDLVIYKKMYFYAMVQCYYSNKNVI